MEPTQHAICFELRYAARVLERQARFWRRVDQATRAAGLLAGTAAFAAITHENQSLTIAFGATFALLQAMEYTLSPSAKAAEAWQTSRIYAAILAKRRKIPVEELEQRLLDARADDPVTVFDALRFLAYNDVACENGRPDACFKPGFMTKLLGLIA